MVKVALPRPRAITTSIAGGVRIVVPVRRNWFVLVFLPFWLAFWTAGGFAAMASLLGGRGHGPGTVFLAVWLAGWAIGEAFAVVTLAWNAFGREVIEATGAALRVRLEALGIGRTREYDGAHVRNVRVSLERPDWMTWSGAMRGWGFSGGAVAFDYGAKTFRVAAVDEAEAAGIAEALRERLPAEGQPVAR